LFYDPRRDAPTSTPAIDRLKSSMSP